MPQQLTFEQNLAAQRQLGIEHESHKFVFLRLSEKEQGMSLSEKGDLVLAVHLEEMRRQFGNDIYRFDAEAGLNEGELIVIYADTDEKVLLRVVLEITEDGRAIEDVDYQRLPFDPEFLNRNYRY